MPSPVYTPRINNNDDQVRLARWLTEPGAAVRPGDPLAEVETDKATFVVEAGSAGFVLAQLGAVGAMLDVGSVLLWLGDSPDEAVPDIGTTTVVSASPAQPPTAKARELLARYSLTADAVPFSGTRLSANDVEEYVRLRGIAPAVSPAVSPGAPAVPDLPAGHTFDLTPEERGMLRSVLWHRDEAVPAYLETAFDPQPWADFAARVAAARKLLLGPMFALMGHQLARYAAAHPRANSTIVNQRRHQYTGVHLGSTVQAGATLYLAVVRDAAAMEPAQFVQAFQNLQRKAMAHRLTSEETQGATIAFTSMERWQVSRHTPILPPYTSAIVAHTVDRDGRAVLGVTYDHRVLSGVDAIALLRHLSVPEDLPELYN